jgi:phage tail-like protein
MAAERDEDPLIGFTFALDLSGKVAGFFTECSGLGSENEVVEHKVVTEKGIEIIIKQPGRLKFNDIVLKRGVTKDMKIWEWRKLVEDGKLKDARTNGSLIMMSRDLQPVARWDFRNAWPSKVTGPTTKSDSNEIGIEEMTIVCEFYERKE